MSLVLPTYGRPRTPTAGCFPEKILSVCSFFVCLARFACCATPLAATSRLLLLPFLQSLPVIFFSSSFSFFCLSSWSVLSAKGCVFAHSSLARRCTCLRGSLQPPHSQSREPPRYLSSPFIFLSSLLFLFIAHSCYLYLCFFFGQCLRTALFFATSLTALPDILSQRERPKNYRKRRRKRGDEMRDEQTVLGRMQHAGFSIGVGARPGAEVCRKR